MCKNAESMAKVITFINNYPPDWINQAFAGNNHIIDHLTSKWRGYGTSKEDSRLSMVKLMSQLDSENTSKLMQWIDTNWDGHAYAKGGGINDKKYVLTSYVGSLVEDSYEEGEIGNSYTDFDVKDSKTFNTKLELVEYMNKVMNVDYREGDFDWESGEGESVQTDVLVSIDSQGDFFPAEQNEKELWKQGKKKLYNAHYWFFVLPVNIISQYKKGGIIASITSYLNSPL